MATQKAKGQPRGLRLERLLSASSDLVGQAQEGFFRCLARWIATYPVLAIAVSLTAYFACAPGMLLLPGSESMFGILRIKTGFLDTFTFKTTDEYRDYMRGTDVFPDTRSLVFVAKPLNRRRLVSSEVMRQIHKAEQQIEATRFESVHGHLGFRDVCERFNSASPCMISSATATLLGNDVAARLSELEALERDGSTPAPAGAALLVAEMSMQQRSSLPLLVASSRPFPGPDASEASLSEWLLEGTAAMTTFSLMDTEDGVRFEKQAARSRAQNLSVPQVLTTLHVIFGRCVFRPFSAERGRVVKPSLPKRNQKASARTLKPPQPHALAKQAAKDINEKGYPENAIVRINQFSSSTIATESLLIGMDNVPLIGITISVMAGYLVLMLGTDTRLPGNSQVKVLLGGTCIPGLSGLASFGLLGYLGHGVSVLGTMVPFLGLAVGVDIIFLMVSSVNAVGPDVKNMEEVMVKALPRGGRAATTTTLTSVSAFSIAAATSADLPSFFWFNIGLVLVLIMNWIGRLVAKS